MRNFLWAKGECARGKAKVAWASVAIPKEEGGLGIRRLEPFNVALLMSHIWNLISRKESLWVQWIHTYKLRGRNFWEIPSRGSLSWSWRKILQVRPVVRKFCWYKLGNGASTTAWHDMWNEYSPLSNHISARQITAAGFQSYSNVADIVDGDNWKWPINWNLQFPSLQSPGLDANLSDKLWWKDRNGVCKEFSVAVAWDDLRPRTDPVIWSRLVWFNQCIPKHSFILWLALKQRLKTQDRMRYWDVQAPVLLCSLCGTQQDTHSHLFFECTFASQVWNKVKLKAELNHLSPVWGDILNGIIPISMKNSIFAVVARLILGATVYNIWQERNARLFKSKKQSVDQLVVHIISVVRLKLLSCRYKKTRRVERFLNAWDLPVSLFLGKRDYPG